MIGGIIARRLINAPLTRKVTTALIVQMVAVMLMITTAPLTSNIYTLVGFTIVLHVSAGFVFNVIYGYCLSRFSKNAGTASGVTGGVMFVASSLLSYGLASLYAVESQSLLGMANLSLTLFIIVLFLVFNKQRKRKVATVERMANAAA
jgi:hypothetical protein